MSRAAVVLVAAVTGAGLAGGLGSWQWGRAAQKEALQAALESRGALPAVGAVEIAGRPLDDDGLRFRQVRLRGRWLDARTVYLENRQMNARPGFVVVTPLQWEGGAVLVQRGWVARDNDDRTRLPALATPSGEVEVVGRMAPPPARLYEFSAVSTGVVRQNIDAESFAREIGVALLPGSVQQTDPAPVDGLLRDWPRPAVDTHKHYGYALQWWGLGVLITGLYVWHQLIRPRFSRR